MKFYMLVLALDTTTRPGSAALSRDGTVLGVFSGDPSVTHGERLPGDLIRLLSDQGVGLPDVDLFAVAAGPGSFTGLRIGIATLQGLALANNRPLIGVSALDALNHAVRSLSPQPVLFGPRIDVGCWMDAQRGQVFAALYACEGMLDGPLVDSPGGILTRWSDGHSAGAHVFAGGGAILYASQIRAAFPRAVMVGETPLLAPSIAELGCEEMLRHGPSAPDAIRPIYVRRSDAELARDRTKS
jgi:tRNA threonylcarbamoyladenosine biosynthesis protein TsaB